MRLIKGRTFYTEPWYKSYRAMMDRCYRENAKNYLYYGGRGISVCDEWHDIEVFEKWAIQSGYRQGLSLDRKDVNGDYCPKNCCWVTAKEQANNRRNTVYLDYNGERKTISQWADLLGIKRSTLSSRICRGWTIEKALARRNYYGKTN